MQGGTRGHARHCYGQGREERLITARRPADLALSQLLASVIASAQIRAFCRAEVRKCLPILPGWLCLRSVIWVAKNRALRLGITAAWPIDCLRMLRMRHAREHGVLAITGKQQNHNGFNSDKQGRWGSACSVTKLMGLAGRDRAAGEGQRGGRLAASIPVRWGERWPVCCVSH